MNIYASESAGINEFIGKDEAISYDNKKIGSERFYSFNLLSVVLETFRLEYRNTVSLSYFLNWRRGEVVASALWTVRLGIDCTNISSILVY